MKVNILDDGLRVRGGHHSHFDLELARCLVAAGHDVQVYGFKGMADDTFDEFQEVAPVTRLFSYYHYAKIAEFDPYAPQVVAFHKKSEMIAADLADVADADLWVW